jgi:hypothetical protein
MDYTVFYSTPNVTSLKATNVCPGFNKDWVECVALEQVRVYGVVIDRRILEGNAVSLSQFHSNDELVHAQGSHQFPMETVRMVYNILKAVDQEEPPRAPPPVKKTKKKKGEDDEEEDGFMAALFNTDVFKKAKRTSTTTFQEGEETLNCVEVFLQDIMDETDTRVVGWMLILVKNNPNYDLNGTIERQALNYALELHREARMKRRPATVVNAVKTLTELSARSKSDWIYSVLDQYQMPLSTKSLGENPAVEHHRLWEPENPACLERIASFDVACRMVGLFLPEAHSRYKDYSNYLTGEGELADMVFARPIRRLDRLDRRPVVFHHALLVEDELARRDIERLSVMHRKHQIMSKQTMTMLENRMHSTDVVDVVTLKAKLNATAFKEARQRAERMVQQLEAMKLQNPSISVPSIASAVRTEFRKEIRSQTFKERLTGLLCNSRNHTPGKAAVLKWLHNEMNESIIRDGKKFSIMTVFPSKVDESMSPLANLMAREALWADTVHGIMTLQKEFVILDIFRLTWYDSRKNPLLPHIALDGAPGIGKSELMEGTRAKCIKGSYRMVGHDSAKAYTNGTCYDHVGFFYDETPLNYVNPGDNGTGDPILKTMLTRNEVITTTTSFTDDGKRITEEIRSSMKVTILMNTNDYSMFPDAMKSRLNPVPVSKYLNLGADMSVKNAQVDPDVLLELQYSKMKEQALVCMVETLIEAGFLAQVNMDSVILQWARMKRFFANNASIFLDPRRDKYVLTMTRALCLKEAVHRVFFTEEVFPFTKEFEYEDLLKVAPYLMATEEQLIFIVTLLEESLTDSLMGEILEALWARCHTEVNGMMCPNFTVDGSVPCHQTLFLKVSGTQPTDEKVIAKAAAMLTKDIQSTKERELYQRSVKTILYWMTGQTVRAERYTGESSARDSTQMTALPMINIRALNSVDSGLEVNRSLLEKYKSRSAGTMDMAIDYCRHKFTTKRVLLTGRTFRERGENMVPSLFKTIEMDPNPLKPNVIENLNYRSTAYCNAVSDLLAVPYDQEEQELDALTSGVASLLIPTTTTTAAATARTRHVAFDRRAALELKKKFTNNRFTVLEQSLDTYYYEKYLDDNGIARTHSKSAFPVETTWQPVAEKDRHLQYPNGEKREYVESFGEYKPWKVVVPVRQSQPQQAPEGVAQQMEIEIPSGKKKKKTTTAVDDGEKENRSLSRSSTIDPFAMEEEVGNDENENVTPFVQY